MIIGRKKEQQIFEQLWLTGKPELMAMYGRRRIGKTFLVREYFSHKNDCCYFEASGIKDGAAKKQLEIFAQSLATVFYNQAPIAIPDNWQKAFGLLTTEIQKITTKKIVIFLDELPWLATRRSGLIQALDYYWNNHWQNIPNLKIILCGSAASWILNNLINAKGGLHNRLTKILLLKPFDLNTTKLFLHTKGCKLTHKQILDLYLVTGGVPFYLEQIQRSQSVAQNINNICFTENGLLLHEFPRLFKSLFDNAEISRKIIAIIAAKRYGVAREELLQQLKLTSGGWINDKIAELEAAGFIVSFLPYEKKKAIHYRVIDEYTMFYLRWIEPEIRTGYKFGNAHWLNTIKSPSYLSWAGYSFETVCFKHFEQIKLALGLQNIGCKTANWSFNPNKQNKSGAQIDLLFDRADDAITICEIKYVDQNQFKIDKDYAKNLLNKIDVFKDETHTKKSVFLALITTFGLTANLYSEDLIQQAVTLDDLFVEI